MKLRFPLILGGVLLGFSGLVLMDCGSSGSGGTGGTSGTGTGGTKGTGSGGSMGTGSGGSTGSGSGGSTGSGSGGSMGTGSGGSMGTGAGGTMGSGDGGAVDCGKAATLHAETADGGLYCPFSNIDGGPTLYCSGSKPFCCAPKYSGTPVPPSTCEANTVTGGTAGTGCPVTGSYVYECEGPLDCAGSSKGKVCCAAGTVALVGPTCTVGQSYVSGNSVGTTCESACAAGESMICDTATGECPSGMTCTPTKLHGNQVGYCQ